MSLNVYIRFNGNCREAIEFYADVFNTKLEQIATFGQMPENPEYPLPEKAKNLIMHTYLEICDTKIMFSDIFPDTPYTVGDNITLAIMTSTVKTTKEYFKKLKLGGTVIMDLQKTDWSKCYGSVMDKFGVIWQLNCEKK